MDKVVDAEIVTHQGRARVRASSGPARSGLAAAFVAAATMLAAVAVMAAMLFGRLLLVSAAATLLWPLVFSPDFTAFVFGSARVPFWKVFFLFAVGSLALRWVRRREGWQ